RPAHRQRVGDRHAAGMGLERRENRRRSPDAYAVRSREALVMDSPAEKHLAVELKGHLPAVVEDLQRMLGGTVDSRLGARSDDLRAAVHLEHDARAVRAEHDAPAIFAV